MAIWELLVAPSRQQADGAEAQRWVKARFSRGTVASRIHDLYQSLSLDESIATSMHTKHLQPDAASQFHKFLNGGRSKQRKHATLERLLESLNSLGSIDLNLA